MKKLLVICLMCVGFLAFTGAGQADAAKVKVVLASSLDLDPENYVNITMKELTERANKYADNEFEFQVYPSMQLGDEQETVRAMQIGTIHISLVATNNFAVFAPSTGWVNMPYLFDSLEEFRHLVDAMWDQNNEWAVKEANCRYLSIQDVGYRQLTTGSKYPVRNLKDAKGIKIRTPQNPLMVSTFQALGLVPTAIAFSETFNALQQGVVDGQEGCFNNVVSLKFYEAQKYGTEINYSVHSSGFLAAEPWLRSLTEKQRNALLQAGREAMEFERGKVAWILENDNERMKRHGMELLGVVEDLPEWVRLGRTAWPKCYEVVGGGNAEKGKQIVDLVLSKKK